MHSFQKRSLTLILSVFIAAAVFSQTASAITFKKKHHTTNPWSLQFMIDESLERGEYHGARFSLTHRFDRHQATRFNLGFVGQYGDYTYRDVHFSDGSLQRLEVDRDFELTGINLSVQYLYNSSPRKGVNMYWGLGPRLSVEDSESDILVTTESFDPYYYDEMLYTDVTRLGLGAEAFLGVEFFLGRNLSLLTEWGITAQNEWYMYDVDYYDDWGHHSTEIETLDDGFHVDASRIKLGLAFHF